MFFKAIRNRSKGFIQWHNCYLMLNYHFMGFQIIVRIGKVRFFIYSTITKGLLVVKFKINKHGLTMRKGVYNG